MWGRQVIPAAAQCMGDGEQGLSVPCALVQRTQALRWGFATPPVVSPWICGSPSRSLSFLILKM